MDFKYVQGHWFSYSSFQLTKPHFQALLITILQYNSFFHFSFKQSFQFSEKYTSLFSEKSMDLMQMKPPISYEWRPNTI